MALLYHILHHKQCFFPPSFVWVILPFLQWNHIIDLDDHIIIIKAVPALVCEQCGEYFLEHDTALKIEKMIENVCQNHAEVFIVKFDELVA